MDDILKDYEANISDRINTLELRSELFNRIRKGNNWHLHFDLPSEDSDENKNKARQMNIDRMKKEIRFLKDELLKYQNALDARKKEEE